MEFPGAFNLISRYIHRVTFCARRIQAALHFGELQGRLNKFVAHTSTGCEEECYLCNKGIETGR